MPASYRWRAASRAIGELAEEFGGELERATGWENRMQLALGVLRGLALTQQFEPHGPRRCDRWPAVCAALLEALDPLPR